MRAEPDTERDPDRRGARGGSHGHRLARADRRADRRLGWRPLRRGSGALGRAAGARRLGGVALVRDARPDARDRRSRRLRRARARRARSLRGPARSRGVPARAAGRRARDLLPPPARDARRLEPVRALARVAGGARRRRGHHAARAARDPPGLGGGAVRAPRRAHRGRLARGPRRARGTARTERRGRRRRRAAGSRRARRPARARRAAVERRRGAGTRARVRDRVEPSRRAGRVLHRRALRGVPARPGRARRRHPDVRLRRVLRARHVPPALRVRRARTPSAGAPEPGARDACRCGRGSRSGERREDHGARPARLGTVQARGGVLLRLRRGDGAGLRRQAAARRDRVRSRVPAVRPAPRDSTRCPRWPNASRRPRGRCAGCR